MFYPYHLKAYYIYQIFCFVFQPNMKMITVNDVQYAVLGVMGKGGSSKVMLFL